MQLVRLASSCMFICYHINYGFFLLILFGMYKHVDITPQLWRFYRKFVGYALVAFGGYT